MQKVSNEYKESMKSPLRDRGYIKLTFGLVNQEAQARASIEERDLVSYYSNNKAVFDDRAEIKTYGTLEENFTKVDGSMIFPPKEIEGYPYEDTGIVSDDLVSNAPFKMLIQLNTLPITIKGLTIDFGDNYPVDFHLMWDNHHHAVISDNKDSVWVFKGTITDATFIHIVFNRMKYPQNRARIRSIKFGYGLVYTNDTVMDSSLETYVSPIGADVPQINFSVRLRNENHYFDVDNPNSEINYFETGQEMDIMYGYQLPSGSIEWIKGGHLLCAEWESDDTAAVIRCHDVLRNLESEYYRGKFNPGGQSYYRLAIDVLNDAGIDNYYIDPRLKSLVSKNPLPRLKHKELLQIIANACRCSLSQSRDGKVMIRSNFMPKATVTTNGETSYSKSADILKTADKREYASLAKNYATVNEMMYFLPRDGSGVNTGFVSREISKADGTFAVNPTVTIKMEAIRSYYGEELRFGQALPAEFKITASKAGVPVKTYVCTGKVIEQTTVLYEEFEDCDEMKIEFIRTAEPFNRIVLNYFNLSDVADFRMTRRDMTSSPTAIKQELIKEVIVPCYVYQDGDKIENLVCEDVEVVSGQIVTYYIQDASYGYIPKLDNQTGLVEILEWGNFYVKLKFSQTGRFRLDIEGYRCRIVEKQAIKRLHARGKTVKWKNPLISDEKMAQDLANWLGDYYSSGVEYEYNTRGNPELDAMDIVYQDNDFHENMKVHINRHTIRFNRSFSGKVVARRVGG